MIYAQIGDTLINYDGMSLETVTNMLTEQKLTFSFIEEEEYKQKLTALETQLGNK
jgi:hypothetical protein